MHKKAITWTSFFGGGFLALLVLMQFDPDEFVRLDALAGKAVAVLQGPIPLRVFEVVTFFGSAYLIVPFALCIVLYLYTQKMIAGRFLLALVGATCSVAVIKTIIARVRPPALPSLGELHSYSFPSGHTTSAMVLYGFIAILLITHFKYRVRTSVAIPMALLVVLSIGVSRIVLAAHYGSDVLAGFFLGGFWLSVVFLPQLTSKEKKFLKMR